jgi:hypothetical protein
VAVASFVPATGASVGETAGDGRAVLVAAGATGGVAVLSSAVEPHPDPIRMMRAKVSK